jgi:predicted nucleotidyltransferase
VAVPWAIESGSRAWGFPSPDSDYDCRFLFVRPRRDYLSPWRPRDVIETPLDAVLDVNGWDVVKAVALAAKGNATVGEWLRSPLVYDGDPAFRDALLALVDDVVDRSALGRHYLHVGRDHWSRSGAADGAECSLKKVFYALRPAAALHWMSQQSGTPPMNLQQLLREAAPPAEVTAAVTELVAAKAVTRELGVGVVAEPVRAWVSGVFAAAAGFDEEYVVRPDARERATDAFVDLVDRWGPS